MTDHASLRAALAGGAEFDDMTIITVRMGDLRALLADYDRARDALAEIADYWKRDQNDQAMYDACWHAINTANAALAQEQGESDE